MKHLFLSFIAIALFSCQSNDIKQKIANDETIQVSQDDKAMNSAIAESKSTFDTFVTAFNNQGERDEAHAIKVQFKTPDGGGEHIWIGDLFLKDGNFYGLVNNTPNATTEVNFGDTVLVDTKNMSDWMYLSDGVLKGGYTIRVLRNQLSAKEKKDFDENVGFIIED